MEAVCEQELTKETERQKLRLESSVSSVASCKTIFGCGSAALWLFVATGIFARSLVSRQRLFGWFQQARFEVARSVHDPFNAQDLLGQAIENQM